MPRQIVKKYDILTSNDVEHDHGHHHKLWWLDIEKLPNGRYQVVTYAQLFRVNLRDKLIEGDNIRRYECGTPFSSLQQAETSAANRISKKKTDYKGYSFFKRREEIEINVSQDIINEFLKKYGNGQKSARGTSSV
jgi:hypothetical protein